MLTSLHIVNFRGLQLLDVSGLDRVNLIAGRNNVGKTTVLEAIFQHCYPRNFQNLLNLERMRGIENPNMDSAGEWLAHEGSENDWSQIVSTDSTDQKRSSSFIIVDANEFKLSMDLADARELLQRFHPNLLAELKGRVTVFRSNAPGEGKGLGVGLSTSSMATTSIDAGKWTIDCAFVSAGDRVRRLAQLNDQEELNTLFSEVESEGKQSEILSALQILEPRVADLAILLFNGRPMLHAQLGLRRKVPLPFVGEGFRRLLSILLAMANSRGGIVLIDEFENGLHHSVLVDIWRAVAEAARRLDIQLFATTHSWECIRAATEAFSSGQIDDLRLHRLEAVNGNIRAVTLAQETLETSVEMNMEVR